MDTRLAMPLYHLGEWLAGQRRCDKAGMLLEHVIEIKRSTPEPTTEMITAMEKTLATC